MYVRKSMGSRPHTAGCTHFPVTADVSGTIYYGAPVALISGGVKPVTASPTSTGSATSPVGVLQGARWEQKSGVIWSPHLPAGIIAAGAKNVVAMVNDDPDLWFMLLASATLTLGAVGRQAAILNPAAGNATTGRSTCALDAASVATGVGATGAALALRIVRVMQPGDPFPEVLCQWNGNVHQYVNGFSV
jgi:hypothetical protein